MPNRTISCFILIFTLLEFVVKIHLTSYDGSHGFISGKHDRYLIDDISSMREDLSSETRNSPRLNMNYLLKFEPEFLDFKQRPLGVPHLERVTLFNVNHNRSIDMTSISGSTVHFHSSFFEDKKIPPLGNTTFNVVFLGREEGPIESNLFIHTTEGHFQYQVKGASIFSPYRLRPIVGVKIPANTSFTPIIYMHNPHSEGIQIVEMYSSGGDFHLELPSGELEGPKDMWEIPPLHTKAVIRVRFNSKTEQNHTAFVRIKLNNTEEVLVVPLEVEVTVNAGVFTPQGSVDFGVGGSFDSPKQYKLHLNNPTKKPLRIHSVSTTSKAIKIQYDSTRIPPDLKNLKGEFVPIEAATLTLDWKTAFEEQDFSGKIIVKYKNGKSVTEIPYYVSVVEGGITYNDSAISFFVKEKLEDIKSRNVIIKNNFLTPLAFVEVSLPLEAQKFFQITKFRPIILKPGEEQMVFNLKLKQGLTLANVNVDSFLSVKTNISQFELPLKSYNGLLELYLPFRSNDNSLDLGLVGLDTKKDAFVLVLNNNPIPISLRKVLTSLPSSQISILGCGTENPGQTLLNAPYINLTKCIQNTLKPLEYAVFKLSLKSSTEGQIWGDISVTTQFELMSIPVHFRVAQGKIEIGPDRLVFDQCFPGKICSHPLRVHSTFSESMAIEDIMSIPRDKRIFSKHTSHIMPRVTKIIGYLYLDPRITCEIECYTGLFYYTNQWLKSLILPKTVTDFDLNLVNMFYNRYLNYTSNGDGKWQNLTIRIDTSEVKGHFFKTRVKMSWPSVVVSTRENNSIINYPLTQVGNRTFRNITIKNPSSHNLLVQLVLDMHYPEVEKLYEGLPPSFIPGYRNEYKLQNHNFFFQESYRRKTLEVLAQSKLKFHEECIPMLLSPGENFSVTIGFKATDSAFNTALLILRNNLTVLEVVRLNAQGASPIFKFGNRKPGSTLPLLFELTEKHLRDCDRDKDRKYIVPNLSVKRSFTARNTGDVTVFVHKFLINGLPCEGYGFKVLNCEPFALRPNGTKKIDIAFTPDFTLAKVVRTLILETSLNMPVNYTLITTIPSYYLGLCASLISRPFWEKHVYYTCVAVMLILLVCIIVLPILEADKILKHILGVFHRTTRSMTDNPLDLKEIGAKTKAEMKCQKIKSEECSSFTDSKQINDKITSNSIIPYNFDICNKQDPDRYTALIPTTGKGKKKLSKRNSGDLNELQDVQKKWSDQSKGKVNKLQEVTSKSYDITNKTQEHLKEKLDGPSRNSEKLIKCEKNLKCNDNSMCQDPAFNSHDTVCKYESNLKYQDCSSKVLEVTIKNNDVSTKFDEKKSDADVKYKEPNIKSEAIKYEDNIKYQDHCNLKSNTKLDNDLNGNKKNHRILNKPNKGEIKKVTEEKLFEMQQYEEETSSTTTESSNNEEVDLRNLKVPMNKKLSAVPVKQEIVKQLEVEVTKPYSKLERKKNQPKTKPKSNQHKESKGTDDTKSENKIIKSKNKSAKERKEKPNLHRKHCDKSTNKISESSTTSSSPTVLNPSPTLPVVGSIWTESKASFSDVVARAEVLSTNPLPKSFSQPQVAKPTVYVEPYKKPAAELGPIGSRRLDFVQENILAAERQLYAPLTQEDMYKPSNSFFTEAHNLAVESSNAFFDPADSWRPNTAVPPIMSLMQGTTIPQALPSPIINQTSETAGNMWLNNNTTSGFWDYNPPREQQTPSPGLQNQQSNGYLWGTSSVWQPWSPEISRPSTRTPPGFGSPNREAEERLLQQQQQPHNPTYNPFSLSNIWTQHQQSNPWNYPQGE